MFNLSSKCEQRQVEKFIDSLTARSSSLIYNKKSYLVRSAQAFNITRHRQGAFNRNLANCTMPDVIPGYFLPLFIMILGAMQNTPFVSAILVFLCPDTYFILFVCKYIQEANKVSGLRLSIPIFWFLSFNAIIIKASQRWSSASSSKTIQWRGYVLLKLN